MGAVTPYHHGISVTNLAAMRAAAAAIGFTKIEPGAETPRHYANVEGDKIGQMIAGWLGDEISTHYVENPATGQQLDLVEIAARSLVARPGEQPAQGDTTVGIPCADPDAGYAAMYAAAPELEFSGPADAGKEDGITFTVDGQRFILTRRAQPFTIVHYASSAWPEAKRFYEDVLGACFFQLPNRGATERYRVENAPGRMDIEISGTTPIAAPSAGKKYPGANHFRILNLNLDAIPARVEATGLGTWLFPPRGGFAQIYGPTNEFIELYDQSVT